MRANILNFPARIFGSEGVSAHFGSGAESNTQKPASFSLEFRKKGHRESWSDLCTLYHYIPPLKITKPAKSPRWPPQTICGPLEAQHTRITPMTTQKTFISFI